MAIISVANSTAVLLVLPVGAVLVANVVTTDRYISIVLPGRMFSNEFGRTAPIPWNSCAA
jgi:hypothetical protein